MHMKEKDFLLRSIPVNGSGDKDTFGGTLSKSVTYINDNTESFDKRLKKVGYTQKTMQDSRIFGDLFKQLKSHKSSYCTYLNSAFNCAPSQMVLPHYVYCFVKEIRPSNVPSTICGEMLTPKIANLMHIPTIYNVFIEKDEENSVSKYSKIASVDFTPYGYEFEDLKTLNACFDECDSIEYCMREFEDMVDRLKKDGRVSLSSKAEYKLLSGFIDQLLFRNVLCEDADFGSKNMGVLIGKNGECTMAPIFDLEYNFCGKRLQCKYPKFVEDGLNYLYPKYSSTVDNFMENLKVCQKEKSFDKVFDSADFLTDFRRDRIKKLLSGNTEIILEKWKEIHKKSKDLGNSMV